MIGTASLFGGDREHASHPNVVIFLVDDLGSADVGFAGGTEIPTPNIDRIANQGVILDQFYVMHVCSPTRAALMTGRYPIRYGLQTGVIRPDWAYGLSLEERLLSNSFQESGYATAILGKWHLGMFTPDYLPTRRGFDFQYGNYCGAIDCFTKMRQGGYDWHRNDKVAREEGYSTEQLAEEAVAWVNSLEKGKPFLMYVPFNAVHAPLQAPERYRTQFANIKGSRGQYAAMLSAVDEAIGKVTGAIDQLRGSDSTIYIFSTDNGGPAPGKTTSNGSLRAGKGTLYEGGVRSCAFMSWKGHIAAGTHIREPLHVVDIFPTLSRIAGINLKKGLPLDGLDFSPLLDGTVSETEGIRFNEERPILINAEAHRGALRLGSWKLVVSRPGVSDSDSADDSAGTVQGKQSNSGSDFIAEKNETAAGRDGVIVELYNLSNDPAEMKDLASTEIMKREELLGHYRRFESQAKPALATSKKTILKTPKVWGEWQEQ
jgi:arylsulfatase A-like enzyme